MIYICNIDWNVLVFKVCMFIKMNNFNISKICNMFVSIIKFGVLFFLVMLICYKIMSLII